MEHQKTSSRIYHVLEEETKSEGEGCCVDTLLCFKNAPADKTYCCQPSTDYSIYCSTGTYNDDVFLTLDTQYFQLNL